MWSYETDTSLVNMVLWTIDDEGGYEEGLSSDFNLQKPNLES